MSGNFPALYQVSFSRLYEWHNLSSLPPQHKISVTFPLTVWGRIPGLTRSIGGLAIFLALSFSFFYRFPISTIIPRLTWTWSSTGKMMNLFFAIWKIFWMRISSRWLIAHSASSSTLPISLNANSFSGHWWPFSSRTY